MAYRNGGRIRRYRYLSENDVVEAQTRIGIAGGYAILVRRSLYGAFKPYVEAGIIDRYQLSDWTTALNAAILRVLREKGIDKGQYVKIVLSIPVKAVKNLNLDGVKIHVMALEVTDEFDKDLTGFFTEEQIEKLIKYGVLPENEEEEEEEKKEPTPDDFLEE